MQTSSDTVQGSAKARASGIKVTRATQLQRLLKRKSGVTIAQLQKSFGWQPHTARAAISQQRKAGCLIDRTEGKKGSVYRMIEWDGAA